MTLISTSLALPSESSPLASLESHFSGLTDPRAPHRIEHRLIDILLITVCGVICGADDWHAIAEYGRSKLDWLKTFLELPNGIPSHDTFQRVFARLNPQQLQSCFIGWVESLQPRLPGELLNVDGKTLRGACEPGQNKSFIHLVSVWSASQHLVLGQRKVDEKSNEITAIPALLQLLAIRGCLVSIDAMGCQREIARTIIEQEADYVLALKGNQGNLHEDVSQVFQAAREQDFQQIEHQFYQTVDKGHGRIEIRRFWTMENTEYLIGAENWPGLRSIGMAESERRIGDKTTVEQRFYLLSIPSDAQRFAEAVREHWSVENNLHWILDVGFNEDALSGTQGHSAENLAVVRHIAVNLITHERSTKAGTRTKRLKAGWDNHYLEKILKVNPAKT